MSTSTISPESNENIQQVAQNQPEKKARGKGMTIREIRYQRALVSLQKEFCREKMAYGVIKLKNSSPFSKNYKPSGGGSKSFARASGILSKIAGGMNYLDYAVIGFSIFSNVRKVAKIFKKHK